MRLAPLAHLFCGVACAVVALTMPVAHGQAAATTTADAKAPAAAVSHFPTSEDLRHLKALGAPLLSPDGKLVLFTVTEATVDGAKTHLWLAPTAGSQDKARQITFSAPSDKRGERGGQWAADGSAIYFLAKRGEKTQLFRLDMRGGEASPYDLKVLPAVDESKLPGAIPPPGTALDKKPSETTTE